MSKHPEELHSIAQMICVNGGCQMKYELFETWPDVGMQFACETIIKSYVKVNLFDISIITILWTVQRSKQKKQANDTYIMYVI